MQTVLPFRITVCGIEELAGHCAAGVSHVVSILDPEWPVPDAFGAFGEHARLELRFHDVIEDLPGMIPPRPDDVAGILAFGRDLAQARDAHLLVHCHAGISRSTATMALLVAQAAPAMPAADVFGAITRIRPKAWPNLLIVEIGDALLGRGGEIVSAAREVHRLQLETRPDLAEAMTAGGRGREVAGAKQTGANQTGAHQM